MDRSLINSALVYFKQIPEQESDVEPKYGDTLFGLYGAGNIKEYIDRPFERLQHYEQLLIALQEENSVKYNNIHKGTAFYYLAWLAFDIKNHSKGLFYIDAALAEDRNHWPHWKNTNSVQFYILNQVSELSERTVKKITEILEAQLSRFSSITGIPKVLNKEDFVDTFVWGLLNDPVIEKRSIISAFYVFLLEFDDLYSMLKTRTTHRGSILPFVTHLFTGGLIFESLLKDRYQPTTGVVYKAMDHFINKTSFKSDFGITKVDTSSIRLRDIINYANSATSLYPAVFSTTAKLRNTTGHNIVWDDIFNDPENYRKLFEMEVDAILSIIAKKYTHS